MNYCTFPQRPPWGQEESGREESRGEIRQFFQGAVIQVN